MNFRDPPTLRSATLVGILLLIAAGAYLRLAGLESRSISHPEMWVPLIPIPEGLADPGERPTLYDTVVRNLLTDTHPAGYYIFMWFWMKLFGASIWAIRLPSVLAGVASIPLVYWLGRSLGLRTAAWIAAALLALNGYHIAWSDFARMYIPAATTGLLSTILLLELRRGNRHWIVWLLYPATLVVGVAFHAYFWTLLAAHILWVLADSWSCRRPLPVASNLQATALILGSPFLAFGAYQSYHPVAFLGKDGLFYASRFVQFSYLLPRPSLSELDPVDATGVLGISLDNQPLLASCVLGFSLILFMLGCLRARGNEVPNEWQPASRPWMGMWSLAALVATAVVLAFVGRVREPHEGMQTTKVLTALPFLLVGAFVLLHRFWRRLPDTGRSWVSRYMGAGNTFAAFFVTAPFAMLAALTVVRGVFVPRGLLLFTPYLLLVLGSGIERIARRRVAAVAVAVVLIVFHLESITAYQGRHIDPVDFRAFVEELTPALRESDVIFLRRHWAATPVLFYLRPDQYSIYAHDYREAIDSRPDARVWVLVFYDDSTAPDTRVALRDYEIAGTVEQGPARAHLYLRAGKQTPP